MSGRHLRANNHSSSYSRSIGTVIEEPDRSTNPLDQLACRECSIAADWRVPGGFDSAILPRFTARSCRWAFGAWMSKSLPSVNSLDM
jgi:hypothetical protein